MGSPSRNVQYHPPRLSEDRLNLPQPHSPSLPTHCSGKSGMRPVRAGELHVDVAARTSGCSARNRPRPLPGSAPSPRATAGRAARYRTRALRRGAALSPPRPCSATRSSRRRDPWGPPPRAAIAVTPDHVGRSGVPSHQSRRVTGLGATAPARSCRNGAAVEQPVQYA